MKRRTSNIVLKPRDLAVGSSRFGKGVVPYHEIKSVIAYANVLARFTNTWFHISSSLNNVGSVDHASVGEWVGTPPSPIPTTRAFWIGPTKVFALLQKANIRPGRLYKTPCRGMKFAGGLRLQDRVLDLSVSVSKLDQAFDQLFSAIIMYQFMLRENQIPTMELHEFRFEEMTSYLTVSVKDKAGFQRFIEAACGIRMSKMQEGYGFEIPGKDDPQKMFVLIVV